MVNMRATNDKLLDRAIRILQTYQPGLDRATAARHINACEGELKVAILAVCLSQSPAQAAALLEAHGGQLGAALSVAR